jgi:DNA-binding transcriptional ArsR family regulator
MLIVEGLMLLAGRPKIGKSWLALMLALAVVSGGKFLGHDVTDRASVLYCALEDSPRRIKKRLSVLGASARPEQLHFLFTLPRLDEGGAEALDAWLRANPAVRLVIVDVFNRIRSTKAKGVDQYQHDASEMAKLQAVALARAVSVVVLTHDRKAAAEDWLERVTGTLGIAGTADTVALLERDRGSANGRLRITGRDLEEEPDLGLEFHDGLWHFIGPGETLELTPERRKIVEALRRYGPMSPSGIAKATDVSVNTVKPALRAMEEAGLVRREGTGRYVAVDTPHTQHTPDLLDGVSRV